MQYFSNILVKISQNNNKMDILESTQKGLLKNVKDGISRPLESREIKKKGLYSFAGHPVQVVKQNLFESGIKLLPHNWKDTYFSDHLFKKHPVGRVKM